MKGNQHVSSLVLDILRYGCIGLLAFVATTGQALAKDRGNDWRQVCYQTNSAMNSACQIDMAGLNATGEGNFICNAVIGALHLESAMWIRRTYVSPESGATYCENRFQRENDNADALVIFNQDLGTAETDINNLQNVQANQTTDINTNNSRLDGHDSSITTLNDQRIAQGDLITSLDSRSDNFDSQFITIDNELINLSDVQALIASDVGVLQTGQGNNSAGIGANGSAIQTLSETQVQQQAEYQGYETVRAASEAQTNNYLTSQQLPVLQNIDSDLDIINSTIAAQQLATRTADIVNTNSIVTKLNTIQGATTADITFLDQAQANRNNALIAQQGSTRDTMGINTALIQNSITSAQSTSTDNVGWLNTQQGNRDASRNQKLDDLKTAIDGVSFDISGQNISIDNTGVESRLDTLNDFNSSGTFTSRTSPEVPGGSISNSYSAIQAAPIVQAFIGIGNVWTGSITQFNCPTATFDLSATILNTSFTMDSHCSLINNVSSTMTMVFQLIWLMSGIFIFMRT